MRRSRVVVLGSTGSIGRQTLDVIRSFPEHFEVVGLSAYSNLEVMLKQQQEWSPRKIGMVEPSTAQRLKDLVTGIEVLSTSECLIELAQMPDADLVVVAVSGTAGLLATAAAIQANKDVALANKETLVSAGEIIMQMAGEQGVSIYPIDSEHSAIWQCLLGEEIQDIEKLVLTASGGPFYGYTRHQLADVKPRDALRHPTWQMGAKITIDSSTLMNKGLEVIEASRLFGMPADSIEVLIHRQSVVHSLVTFCDGSTKAQLGVPDMREPIQFALFRGKRQPNNLERLDLTKIGCLTFDQPDYDAFPCLGLAYQALRTGGTLPAVLNAANEVAVHNFLQEKIGYLQIADCVAEVCERHRVIHNPGLDDILLAEQWASQAAADWCKQ